MAAAHAPLPWRQALQAALRCAPDGAAQLPRAACSTTAATSTAPDTLAALRAVLRQRAAPSDPVSQPSSADGPPHRAERDTLRAGADADADAHGARARRMLARAQEEQHVSAEAAHVVMRRSQRLVEVPAALHAAAAHLAAGALQHRCWRRILHVLMTSCDH